MLYLIYGDRHEEVRTKASELRAALHKKRPDAELFKLDEQGVTPDRLQELAAGQGLFERKYIVQFDRVMEDANARATILDAAGQLGTSENVFLVVDGPLDKKTLNALTQHAQEVYAFEQKRKKQEEFNIFSLTDALGARDKKTLWVEFWKARRAFMEAENIHGVLHWQVKSMLLARARDSAEEVGMKAFPFKKAKEFAGNYSDDELTDLSRRLMTAYHEARRGNGELADNLERVILHL